MHTVMQISEYRFTSENYEGKRSLNKDKVNHEKCFKKYDILDTFENQYVIIQL